MTRINVIPVSELTSKHLIAEYRELPRIFTLSKNYQKRGLLPTSLPQEYTLGKGHVKFFYDKLAWLVNRQVQLINEMKSRGYNPQFTNPEQLIDETINPIWLKHWVVTDKALYLNQQRITDRLTKTK